MGRLKPETPPRIRKKGVNWGEMKRHDGDVPPTPFSYRTGAIVRGQLPCHITRTEERKRKVALENTAKSAFYG